MNLLAKLDGLEQDLRDAPPGLIHWVESDDGYDTPTE